MPLLEVVFTKRTLKKITKITKIKNPFINQAERSIRTNLIWDAR
jgi:hypothetical protein